MSPVFKKNQILFLVSMIALLMGMGVDLYVPSLPDIASYFHVARHPVQLTIALYMLGYSVGQLVFGVLSDTLGRRRILLSSTILYIAISFLSAHAPNITCLIVYRLLQGIGIAGMGISTRAILVDCFSGLSLTKAMTYCSINWALGPVIGPFIGSYLQHYINWQANFYFFMFFGCLIFIYAVTIPETNANLHPLRLRKILSMFKIVMSRKDFMIGNACAALVYSALVLFNLIAPFMVQVVLKYSVVAYGYFALCLGLAYFIGNICNRFLIQYFAPLRVTFFAMIAALLAALTMLVCSLFIAMSIYILFIPMFLIFILCGLIFPTMAAYFLGMFPKLAGTANAVYGSIMAGGVFIVTGCATALKTTTLWPLALVYSGLFFFSWILFSLCIQKSR